MLDALKVNLLFKSSSSSILFSILLWILSNFDCSRLICYFILTCTGRYSIFSVSSVSNHRIPLSLWRLFFTQYIQKSKFILYTQFKLKQKIPCSILLKAWRVGMTKSTKSFANANEITWRGIRKQCLKKAWSVCIWFHIFLKSFPTA